MKVKRVRAHLLAGCAIFPVVAAGATIPTNVHAQSACELATALGGGTGAAQLGGVGSFSCTTGTGGVYASSTNGTAFGHNAEVHGNDAVAIGFGGRAVLEATAIGSNAVANQSGAVALGFNTQSLASNSIAIGGGSGANAASVSLGGANGIAIGLGASIGGAISANSIAIGVNATVNAQQGTAVGLTATAGEFGTAMGASGFASNFATAIGSVSSAGVGGTALGWRSASGVGATAVGILSVASAVGSVAVGTAEVIVGGVNIAGATQQDATAVGFGAGATAVGSSGFGQRTVASGDNSVALGANSEATAQNAVALGTGVLTVGGVNTSGARATEAVAVGYQATASGNSSVALGHRATVTAANAVAIGSGSVADVAGTVSVGSVGTERRIVNVAAGAIAANGTDAVNTGQLFTANQRVAAAFGSTLDVNGQLNAPSYTIQTATFNNVGSAFGAVDTALNTLQTLAATSTTNVTAMASAFGGGAGIDINGNFTAPNYTIQTVAFNNVGGALTAVDTALTALQTQATTGANNTQAIANALGGGAAVDINGNFTAPSFAVQGSAFSSVGDALGALDTQVTQNTGDIATLSSTVAGLGTANSPYFKVNSTAPAAQATGPNAIALGPAATASGTDSMAFGNGANATQAGAIAMGTGASSTGVNAIAIGAGASATGSVAMGAGALASNGGAAFGDNSTATGTNAGAFGPGATATAANSVAIGGGSIANTANTVSFGSAGNERRLTNVAAGVAPTDAVNVSQIQGLTAGIDQRFTNVQSQINNTNERVDRANAGVAMAMAMGGAMLPDKKKFAVAMNYGVFSNQSALALSAALRIHHNIVASGAIGYGMNEEQLGGRAGVQMAW